LPSSNLAGMDFGALELIAARGQVHPIAIMKMEHRIGRDHGVRFSFFRLVKVAVPNMPSLRNLDWPLDAHLGRAKRWIEHRADVADAPGQRFIG